MAKLRVAAALSVALLAPCAALADDVAELQQSLRDLQANDAMLQTIGFRLASANAPFCADQQLTVGLQLADVRNFSQPTRIRQALRIKGDFAVEAIAAGSPATQSRLAAGTEIATIEGEALGAIPAADANDNQRLNRVYDRVDAALTREGNVRIGLGSGDEAVLTGVPACRSRFELLLGGNGGQADGQIAQISLAALLKGKVDDERAWVVAHELAHNVLRHRAKLKVIGRTVANVRDTEREADRLTVWLMANAGYDPKAASVFVRNWGSKGLAGHFTTPDHDRTETRIKIINAEFAVLEKVTANAAGLRDWRFRFTPYPGEVKAQP